MQIQELNRLYNEAESYLHEIHAEQRSNVLLVAGNHYTRKGSRFWKTIRNSENLTRSQKLRLTKNHIQKIVKLYVNNIISLAPGVKIGPRHKSEVQDQKDADLNNAVWEDLKRRHKYKRIVRRMAEDFTQIGEVWLKVFFDPMKGDKIADELVLDDETGMPLMDEEGRPITVPRFQGDIVYETFHGFNVLNDPDARSYEQARWVCVKKMMSVQDLRKLYADQPEKHKYITESAKQTYKIFDGNTGSYINGKGLVMVREFYFRPTPERPNGYFYYATEHGVLEHGEIPLGRFPVLHIGFDDLPTSCRAYSLIKHLRPYQAEINRTASKIAEHQITIGDDKIVTQSGASISAGGTAHGVKHIKVTGGMPQILQGRSGEQFVGYMQGQISEMYNIANLSEDDMKNDETAQLDPYAMLFRSMRDKKKFSIHATKFEELLVEMCDLSLRLMREYIQDEQLVPMLDRREWVNVPEFKNSQDLSYDIVIQPQADDLETQMGKHLTFNHLLQYAGQQLSPGDLGKIIRAMPYANDEEAFGDLTLDYDNAKNDILALDRGEWVEPAPFENHEYIIQRLLNRMKMADFKFLAPFIRENYNKKYQAHLQLLQEQKAEIERANSGFIPTGGFNVSCDFYVPSPTDPTKQKRLRVPSEAVQWLVQKLESQGTFQGQMQELDPQVQADMGGQADQPPPNVLPMPNPGMN